MAYCTGGVDLFYCPEAPWRPWRVVVTDTLCRRTEKRFRTRQRAEAWIARRGVVRAARYRVLP